LGPATDPFIIGQFKDSVQNLGDAGTQTPSGLVPNWDPAFVQPLHGVILISGESHETLHKKKLEIECIFGVRTIQPSIFEVTSLRGDVRPGAESGHEHFGFLDGISNPAVIGFDKDPNPGPVPVNPGVVVTGHTGDPSQATRASWAVDGSFLVFRYLFQQVPEFNDFLRKNPIAFQDLTPEEGSDLLGARLVGRWKSGAPIDLSPFKDDPVLAADPKRYGPLSPRWVYKLLTRTLATTISSLRGRSTHNSAALLPHMSGRPTHVTTWKPCHPRLDPFRFRRIALCGVVCSSGLNSRKRRRRLRRPSVVGDSCLPAIKLASRTVSNSFRKVRSSESSYRT
jgi:hypothetical protein